MSGYDKEPEYGGPPLGRWWWVGVAAMIAVPILAFITWEAIADESQICPKYGKCVPAAAFDCTLVDRSSLVTCVCYSEPKEYMIVRLKTTDYHYCAIPAGVVAAFLSADSLGRFYNQNIKSDATDGLYDCRNHPVPKF